MKRIARGIYTPEIREQAVKYGQIESLRQQHPVANMCRVLDVSENGSVTF